MTTYIISKESKQVIYKNSEVCLKINYMIFSSKLDNKNYARKKFKNNYKVMVISRQFLTNLSLLSTLWKVNLQSHLLSIIINSVEQGQKLSKKLNSNLTEDNLKRLLKVLLDYRQILLISLNFFQLILILKGKASKMH